MTSIKQHIKSLCTPARIYLATSLVLIAMTLITHFDIMYSIISIFWSIVWTYVFNLLCTSGYSNISWLLVAIISTLQVIAILGMLGMFLGYIIKKI